MTTNTLTKTYTYIVNQVDGGDGGISIDSFTTKQEAINCYWECVKDFPDWTFDVAVEDEDGEWIDVFQPTEPNKENNTMTITTINSDITIEQLREAVINDYAKLVYEDYGTEPDEMPLEDYIEKVNKMTWDELVGESWFIEGDKDCTLESYVECFEGESVYADIPYQKNEDGSTTPLE